MNFKQISSKPALQKASVGLNLGLKFFITQTKTFFKSENRVYNFPSLYLRCPTVYFFVCKIKGYTTKQKEHYGSTIKVLNLLILIEQRKTSSQNCSPTENFWGDDLC